MATENGKMVQDLVSLDYMRQTATSVPAKISTLLVRRPGRVAAAMEFYDKAMSSMTFGAMADEPPHRATGASFSETEKDEEYGPPTAAFLRARDAALQCLTAYFSGLIPDELLVEAEFEVGGETINSRFKATVDESGRVMDPRYAPQPGVVSPKSAVCMKDAVPKKVMGPASVIRTPAGGATPMMMPDKTVVYLPSGHKPEDVACIEETMDASKGTSTARATFKDGSTVHFDPRTGILLLHPTE